MGDPPNIPRTIDRDLTTGLGLGSCGLRTPSVGDFPVTEDSSSTLQQQVPLVSGSVPPVCTGLSHESSTSSLDCLQPLLDIQDFRAFEEKGKGQITYSHSSTTHSSSEFSHSIVLPKRPPRGFQLVETLSLTNFQLVDCAFCTSSSASMWSTRSAMTTDGMARFLAMLTRWRWNFKFGTTPTSFLRWRKHSHSNLVEMTDWILMLYS